MAHKVAAKAPLPTFLVKSRKVHQPIIDPQLVSGKHSSSYPKLSKPSDFFAPFSFRIIEYQKNAPASAGVFGQVHIEFWDVSGDWRYEKCWGPIQKGAHGIIFVLDPASPAGEEQLTQF